MTEESQSSKKITTKKIISTPANVSKIYFNGSLFCNFLEHLCKSLPKLGRSATKGQAAALILFYGIHNII